MIVIADDFDDSAELLAIILEEDFPCVTLCAKDGREPVELVAAHHPWAVVLDIDMPRLNGIDAAREIRAVDPASPALIFAMTGGPHLADAKASGHFDRVFSKPLDAAVLSDALKAGSR